MCELPIRRFLDASTAHLSQEAEETLANGGTTETRLVVTSTEFGYFVFASSNDEGELSRNGVPQDLIELFGFARQHGCAYIFFDADAPVIESLPVFER